MKMTHISRIADWVTIITAPLTVASTIIAWSGVLDNGNIVVRDGSLARVALAIAAIAAAWTFFLLAHVRLSKHFQNTKGSTAAFFSIILSALLGVALFVCVELLFLNTIFGSSLTELGLTLWLVIPIALWVLGCMAALITQSVIE